MHWTVHFCVRWQFSKVPKKNTLLSDGNTWHICLTGSGAFISFPVSQTATHCQTNKKSCHTPSRQTVWPFVTWTNSLSFSVWSECWYLQNVLILNLCLLVLFVFLLSYLFFMFDKCHSSRRLTLLLFDLHSLVYYLIVTWIQSLTVLTRYNLQVEQTGALANCIARGTLVESWGTGADVSQCYSALHLVWRTHTEPNRNKSD